MWRDIGDPFDIGVHIDICVFYIRVLVFWVFFFLLVIVSFDIGVF